MRRELDNIHYNFREIDGYNKPFNIIISPRELGKTTMAWNQKVYRPWQKNHKPWLYLVRNANEITDSLIEDIEMNINKFNDDIVLTFARGNLESGICDIYIDKQLFLRILALNIKLRRIKLSKIPNIGGVLMDEYIIDPKSGEKYLPQEEMKIKEVYTTYRREADGILKMYFLGNPYSLYNPLFMWLGVDTRMLKPGVVLTGEKYVVQCAVLSDQLREKILEENPLYQFDESYKMYAFDGLAVNDMNIRTGSFPPNYQLRFVVRINNTNIGIFKNDFAKDKEDRYYCKEVMGFANDRNIFTFNFTDVINKSVLVGLDERRKLCNFKNAFRKRHVVFSNINIYYLVEEIYYNL